MCFRKTSQHSCIYMESTSVLLKCTCMIFLCSRDHLPCISERIVQWELFWRSLTTKKWGRVTAASNQYNVFELLQSNGIWTPNQEDRCVLSKLLPTGRRQTKLFTSPNFTKPLVNSCGYQFRFWSPSRIKTRNEDLVTSAKPNALISTRSNTWHKGGDC